MRNKIASLLLGAPFDGRIVPVCKVGTGMTQEQIEQWSEILEQPEDPAEVGFYDLTIYKPNIIFKPKLVVQVKYDCFSFSKLSVFQKIKGTEYGFALRFPVFERIRTDKGIGDATPFDTIYKMASEAMLASGKGGEPEKDKNDRE